MVWDTGFWESFQSCWKDSYSQVHEFKHPIIQLKGLKCEYNTVCGPKIDRSDQRKIIESFPISTRNILTDSFLKIDILSLVPRYFTNRVFKFMSQAVLTMKNIMISKYIYVHFFVDSKPKTLLICSLGNIRHQLE